jgi:hypothetical protein
LFFNLGVEAGQILFIATLIVVASAAGRIFGPQIFKFQLMRNSVVYGIGGVGMMWVIQRVAGF